MVHPPTQVEGHSRFRSEMNRGLRIIIVVLVLLLALLQYRLWVSENGYREVLRLEAAVERQAKENQALLDRNRQMEAELRDLKKGFQALEERARSDLGMIGEDETFYIFAESPDEAEAEADEP